MRWRSNEGMVCIRILLLQLPYGTRQRMRLLWNEVLLLPHSQFTCQRHWTKQSEFFAEDLASLTPRYALYHKYTPSKLLVVHHLSLHPILNVESKFSLYGWRSSQHLPISRNYICAKIWNHSISTSRLKTLSNAHTEVIPSVAHG